MDQVFENFIDDLEFTPEQIKLFEEIFTLRFHRQNKEAMQTSIKASQKLIELKQRQSAITDTIIANNAHLELVANLKEKFDSLQKEIEDCELQQDKTIDHERDIRQCLKWARVLLEHPAELLIDRDNPVKTKQLLRAIFEELPTYEELKVGTPKLKPLFKQKETLENSKYQNVAGLGFEPRL